MSPFIWISICIAAPHTTKVACLRHCSILMKKRISIKKAIIVIGMISALLFLAFIIMAQLTKPEQPQKIKQPVVVEPDEYENSLVERERGDDRTDLFNYDIKLSAGKTVDFSSRYKWAKNSEIDYDSEDVYDFKNAHILGLSDGSELYIDGMIVLDRYNVSFNGNRMTIKPASGDYGYEIIKINNEPYKFIDFYDFEDESVIKFQNIRSEYYGIYESSETISGAEADGLNTYKKVTDFVKENGVEKDIYFYTADQIRGVMEKAFETSMDTHVLSPVVECKEGYTISNLLEKNESLNEEDDIYSGHKYDVYYLLGTGKDIYAIHFYRTTAYATNGSTVSDHDYINKIYPMS